MSMLEILLVEDNPDDIDLTREALADAELPNHVTVVEDGVAALAALRRKGDYVDTPEPGLILLDLKLPKKGGLEVLEEIKQDVDLKRIPVVVLTTSDEARDVLDAYEHHANAYVVKPIDLDEFMDAVKAIVRFWGRTVLLPPS